MMHSNKHFFFIFSVSAFLCPFLFIKSYAQDKKVIILARQDTFFLAKKRGLLGKLGQSIAVSTPLSENQVVAAKNIDGFVKFKGKLINTISIQNVSFGISVNDISIVKTTFLTDAANYLHKHTKERVVADNLFFHQKDTLYPNVMADNLRYLRSLPYLQDANIIAKTNSIDTNLVDISIFYKDVLSISGTGQVNGNNIYGELQDDNFLGTAQRVKFESVYDLDRKPKYGFGGEYLNRNINGSFFNLTLGYQNNGNSYSSGKREETNIYTIVDLPLVSPYYLWTGALEISDHHNTNKYWGDSLFKSDLQYSYRIYDVWAGYNISGRDFEKETEQRKQKRFLAARIMNKAFKVRPEKYMLDYNFQYSNITSVLGAYTFFKQEYYHTSFLYGFGRNEDVPEGYNAQFIAGWADRDAISRPYIGVDVEKNFFTKRKSYFDYIFRAGSYFQGHQLQDASVLLDLETFTRLRKMGRGKWFSRHFLSGSIAHQFNRVLDPPLVLNSSYGIAQFNGDSSTLAFGRLSINCESVFYNTWKLVGFNFAPFFFANLSYIKTDKYHLDKGNGYASVGGGVRTRNENLVFGTIELRAFYFPRTVGGMQHFNIAISSDLRFKYNSQYIKRPDFIQVN
ncbi:hypothetical protein [Parasediminibacterium sp. JCM 36343]|uniref:hypothetical protein n=1 Tax=Parasediminibacterium sp. JCM 36343 TaxID=3374279 RepID=UPI00397B9CF3